MLRQTAVTASPRPAQRGKPADTAAIVQGLRRIVKALQTYSQDVRSGYGLTGPQLWAMKMLQRNGRLHALEDMRASEVHGIRRAVDRLVEAMEATDVTARFFFSDE